MQKEISLFAFSVVLFTVAVLMAMTFYAAFFHPSGKVTIAINNYNEGLLEGYIYMPVVMYAGIMLMAHHLKEFWKLREGCR